MEPDVVRLYSSSPPPLDEGGEEEEEEEFGDFGGYCSGVSSSFSFSEIDTPATACPSHAAETSPPDLYITSVQNVSTSGKNVRSEENLRASLTISNPLVKENSVGIDDHENKEPEVSEIVINGFPPCDLMGPTQSVVSNTDLHRSASNPVPRDFEKDSGTGQQGDISIGGEGQPLSNGHSKLTTGMVLDGVASGEETSHAPSSSSAAFQISQEEVAESERNVVDDMTSEFKEISSSNTSDEQSIKESREHQEQEQKDVSTGLQVPSGEESFASTGEVVPESESEDFGDWTETSVGLSDAQLCKDSVDCSSAQLPGVVPDVEMREDAEDVCGTRTDFTVEVIPDSEAGEQVLRELKGGMDMDEGFGDFRDAVGVAEFSRTESATQEGFADFVTALSGCSTDDDFGETDTLKDWKEEEELPEEDQEKANDKNTKGTWCSELPPSDSFADFSSAPFEGLAGGGDSWAAFGLQEECESPRESWSAFGEGQQSGTANATSGDNLCNDNVLGELSCKLQDLFQSTFFPSEDTSEVTEVVTLQDQLEPRDHGEISSTPVQSESAALWRHLLDTHSAHGLKVQWVGSRSNRILLDCLGIHNILFTGQKKRPMIVPMFASGLGMLEPTKDPVRPSPTSSAPLTPSSPGQGRTTLCTLQVASSPNSREDGVDPELYELTTAKLDNSNVSNNVAEAFNKLMETVEKTSTVTRKAERDGEISEEAARVISLLPDMSFMRARVLMFPYSLNPAANCP